MPSKFCGACGAKLDRDDLRFCSSCGHSLAGHSQGSTFQYGSANDLTSQPTVSQPVSSRDSILADLERSRPTVDRVYEKMKEIHEINSKISDLRSHKSNYISTRSCMILVAGIFASAILSLILFMAATRLKMTPVYLLGAAVGVACVFVSINLFRRSLVPDRQKDEAKYHAQADQYEVSKAQCQQAITEILATPEGQFAQKVVPQDYFYPGALSMFIYYIRNGHAESMKEAVKEYDQYLHRCKMEYEAMRSRMASERTAAAAEQTAYATEDIRRSAHLIEQHTANTAFWTTYIAWRIS